MDWPGKSPPGPFFRRRGRVGRKPAFAVYKDRRVDLLMRLAKTVVEPTAKNGFIFTILGTKWGFLWLWLLIINAAAFLAYGLDKLLAKLKARHEKVPRLPERNLLLLAIVGGGIGAWLGMEVFRHKTQHRSFRVIVPLFTCLWLVIVTGAYLYFNVFR